MNIDWNKFAVDLKDNLGECLVEPDMDENNPLNWFLQDVTVYDIVEFCKDYFH